jgi:hypothetical protein
MSTPSGSSGANEGGELRMWILLILKGLRCQWPIDGAQAQDLYDIRGGPPGHPSFQDDRAPQRPGRDISGNSMGRVACQSIEAIRSLILTLALHKPYVNLSDRFFSASTIDLRTAAAADIRSR